VGKRAGDACTDAVSGASGACKDETCTNTKPNGTSISYARLMCVPGAASDGGCAIATSSQVRQLGAWAVAGLFPLLFLLARRRRR
jgi:hypothetical protein